MLSGISEANYTLASDISKHFSMLTPGLQQQGLTASLLAGIPLTGKRPLSFWGTWIP